MHKYNETKFMWTKRGRGEMVSEEEAHNLRRSARVQVNKEALQQKLVNGFKLEMPKVVRNCSLDFIS